MKTTRLASTLAVLTVLALVPLACSDATDIQLLEIEDGGSLVGRVFLDLDGSGGLTGGDEPIGEIEVRLVTSAGAVVSETLTDSMGAFAIDEVPVGSYRLTLDPAALGDTLDILGGEGLVTVRPADTLTYTLGATFPTLSLDQVPGAPLGIPVFTSGIALNSRVNFGDGQVHFSGGSAYLRALNVERAPVVTGDSVRMRGRVVLDNGRVALRDVTPFVLIPQAALPAPVEVSVADAASAGGGPLDAALVRIGAAEITDTSTNAAGDFRFWAVGAADSVEVVIREFLGLNTSLIRPDTIIRIERLSGLLSPFDDGSGTPRWRVLPRGVNDIDLEVREADIGVTMTSDTTRASLGDTVEFQIVVDNLGPVGGTRVEVRDTIPTAFAHVSSTATVGTYDAGTGVWDVGDMSVGASDTLWIRMSLEDDSPTSSTNVAESLGSDLEVDPDSGDDRATVTVEIVAPG